MNILVPNRKQIITPYDMPLFWKPSVHVMAGYYSSAYTAAAPGYFTGISTNTFEGVTYAYTSTANVAGSWATIVNVTGKGLFIDAESRAADSGSIPTISLRVTIDGKAYTFSRNTGYANAKMRLFLGLYIPVGVLYNADTDSSVRLGTASLYGNAGSPTAVTESFLYKPSVSTVIERMSGKLPTFKNSLKVETMSSLNGGGVTDAYAACRYRLD